MTHYGIRGVALDLVRSYLSGRKQLVDCGTNRSSLVEMEYGVAQGSVLGALFFVLYINDLPPNIEGAVVNLYADDTTILTFSKDREVLHDKAQDALVMAGEWFTSNQLRLNVSKTKELLITTKSNNSEEVVKLLGLHFSGDMKWNAHISQLTKQLAGAIYAIRRIRKIATYEAAKMVFHGCFMSRATYGILVWGASPAANEVFLQQKQALRALTQSDYRAGCRSLFQDSGILTIPSIYIYRAVLHIYNNSEQMYPNRETIHNHRTRNRTKKDIPFRRITRTQTTTSYMGTKLYNKLPDAVLSQPPQKFQRLLKDFLIKQAFYSIHEFLSGIYDKKNFNM